MAKAKESGATAVATRPTTSLAHVDFGADAGQGFENAGREAFAIPFLAILQSGSPQCKRSESAYIKGAEEGMWYNTASQEVYNGDEGIRVIPANFNQTFVEWGLREKGGGFIMEHDYITGSAMKKSTHRDDKGRDILSNGNALNDHRNHYLLYEADGIWQPILMSLTSTGIKFSRNWMLQMQRLSQQHRAPTFGLIFRLTTVAQSNDKGTWYTPQATFDSLVTDVEVYEAAKLFYKQVQAGSVKTGQRDEPTAAAGSINNPDEF